MKGSIFIMLIVLIFFSSTVMAIDYSTKRVEIEFFYSSGCEACDKKIPIIDEIKEEYSDTATIEVYKKDIKNEIYWKEWRNYGFYEIPAVVINGSIKIPSQNITKENIEKAIKVFLSSNNFSIMPNQSIPSIFGKIGSSEISLPVLAIMLGFLDAFNPCALFILLVILSLLVYSRSRERILLIGGIFVFFSALIYFLFMSTLLNIFLLSSHIAYITLLAGIIALFLGLINVKDFFFFRKGISASIPENKRLELFGRARKLMRIVHLPTLITGTILLAITANLYEGFCTLGFPLLFTRILTLHKLPLLYYYLYIVLYDTVYVTPLIVIVIIFSLTLGKRKLTALQGRTLKLISGTMMVSMGLALIFSPHLLNNVIIDVLIVVASILISISVAYVWKSNNS